MMSKKVVSIAVAFALTATSPLTKAIGLGELSSKAVLNQPLQIDIPIIATNYEAHYFKVELANRSQHDRVGIAYPSHLPRLYFKTYQTDSGPQLRITSVRSVKEPIVNFLLEVEYQDGRVLKEITLLLDPKEYATDQIVKETTLASPSKKMSEKPTPYLAQASNEDIFVTVASGQSLWRVARRWQVEGVNISDKMTAIFINNPSAFVAGDRDRLKLGAQLRLSSDSLLHIANRGGQLAPALAISGSHLAQTYTAPTQAAPNGFTNEIVANSANTPVAQEISSTRAKLLEQIALEKQLREINEKIQSQLAINQQLREALAQSANGNASLTALTGQANITSNSIEIGSAKSNKSVPIQKSPLDAAPLASSSLVDNFSQGEISRNNWLLIIGVTLAILFAHILWILTRNKKIKNFSKALDQKFKKLSPGSKNQENAGHSIKKIKIPVGQSTIAQIKYLNSAADFYIRCERFDLAKELVNESLVQFSTEPKIIRAISKIRVRIFKQLDAHLHSNISSKAESAIRPDPNMIVDIIHDFGLEEDSDIELDMSWDKKAS